MILSLEQEVGQQLPSLANGHQPVGVTNTVFAFAFAVNVNSEPFLASVASQAFGGEDWQDLGIIRCDNFLRDVPVTAETWDVLPTRVDLFCQSRMIIDRNPEKFLELSEIRACGVPEGTRESWAVNGPEPL